MRREKERAVTPDEDAANRTFWEGLYARWGMVAGWLIFPTWFVTAALIAWRLPTGWISSKPLRLGIRVIAGPILGLPATVLVVSLVCIAGAEIEILKRK
jgi:hypothetical protein